MVFIENYRKGARSISAIGWEEMHKGNPRLIYCSVSRLRPHRPYAERRRVPT